MSYQLMGFRPVSRAALALAVAGVLAGCAGAKQAAPAADILITGGYVYDGGDVAGEILDVVVSGEYIIHLGENASERFRPEHVIDAAGKIVAPGFIDTHTHPDRYIRSEDRAERQVRPWLYQGVTTLAVGVDGGGTPNIAAERALHESQGVGVNLVPYVGFGEVRRRVLGEDARVPTAEELERMRDLVAKGMCEGGFGLSTGLFYAPQSFSKTEEVIELAKEAAKRGGIYDTHQRDESSYTVGLLESTDEVIRIGREASIPVHFGHIKALGVDVHGMSGEVIARIEAARADGMQVTADQYPWTASGSSLNSALLPRWAVDGGREALLERLDQPAKLEKIRVEMSENMRRRGGASSLLLRAQDRPWTGKTLAEMSEEWEVEPIEAALRIIRSGTGRDAGTISFNMDEADLRLFMQQPWVITSSDGSEGHPRMYASYPKKYVDYVRNESVINLEEFIRSSTGRPAQALDIEGRGYLREGHYADIVVFDPESYAPRADYLNPRELSTGVDYLLVNGQLALENGEATGVLAGRMLAHEPIEGSCP